MTGGRAPGVSAAGTRWKRRFSGTSCTTLWSLTALLAGGAAGVALRPAGFAGPALGALNTAGTLWMNALRMLALPLAVTNTLCVVTRERSSRAAGQIGGAIGIYLVLPLAAAGAVLLLVPPILHWTRVDRTAVEVAAQRAGRPATPAPPATADSIAALMSRNMAKAAVNEDFLPLLIFAFLFGMALRRNSAGAGGAVIRFFEGVTEALMVMVAGASGARGSPCSLWPPSSRRTTGPAWPGSLANSFFWSAA